MAVVPYTAGPLTQGKEVQVLKSTKTAAGTETVIFSVDAETVLVSAAIISTSGDVTIKVYTQGGDDGQELEIISFPTISAPTTSLVMRKAAQTLQRVKVEVTYTGACAYNIRARGVAAAAASVTIEGSGNFTVEQKDVTTSAAVLLAAGLTDRRGILVRNHATTETLYIAETLAKATTADGYPVPAGGNIAIDLQAGAAIYAVADSGTIDTRIVQVGG
jgi:hypothetical protein